MNRRSFFSFLAVAPVAVALPVAAPRPFRDAFLRLLNDMSDDQLARLWDGKAFLKLRDARTKELIKEAHTWRCRVGRSYECDFNLDHVSPYWADL